MKRLLPLALVSTLLPAAEPVAHEGFAFVRQLGGIAEYRMAANDLTVLLLEDRSAPVVTFMVTYRVGSRNEVTGTTGATHLLEHLMFKGSAKFNAALGNGYDTLLDRVGGYNNATTWLDRTNYYANLPSEHLALAVELEADRMRHLLLREEDRNPEMTVVRNEFEQDENNPASALDKEVTAAAFIAHPYHHPVIGWRSDIEKVSIEQLRAFYDTFYWPNNATVSVIGDFSSANALDLVRRHFGAIPRSPQPIPVVHTEEPAQSGPRRVLVRRPGEVGVVQVVFKVPPARHADHAPLLVLAALLGEGKSSRLYRALIDTNLAIEAHVTKNPTHDDFLFNTTVLLAPDVGHETAERKLRAEIDRVRQDGVEADEVTRAANTLLAAMAYGRDGTFAIASELNEAIAVGDWTLYATLREKLQAVTPAEVQRVARRYLQEEGSTTGWFVPQPATPGAAAAETPTGAKSRAAGSAGPSRGPYFYRDPNSFGSVRRGPLAAKANAGAAGAQPATAIAPKVRRRPIAAMDVLTLRTSIQDVVTIRGVLGAGPAFAPPGQPAVAELTAGLLDQGTTRRDKFALASLLEQTGATLTFGTGTHTLNFSAKCLRSDLPLVLGLLIEQLRSPRLDPAELAKLKQQLNGRIRRQLEDPDYRAERAFARAVFPPGHPNHPPEDAAYLAAIEATTIDQVRAFHAAYYGPTGARIVLVGDVDDTIVDRELGAALSGWTGGSTPPVATRAPALTAARVELVPMPGKTSVSVVLGQPSGLLHRDPARPALELATAALGGGFFSARLLDIIRNREGLTYGITARLAADTYADGSWFIAGAFAPELLARGLDATWRELRRFQIEGLSAAELATVKSTLAGSFKLGLATTDGLAATLLTTLQRGHDLAWIDAYPGQMQSLTLEQVNAAIRAHLHPDRMVLVQAGTLPAPASAN